jgi:Zn-dependent protease with chaperone function
MNLYLLQNNEPTGPFPEEEIRQKIYSGELARTVSARREDGAAWHPVEDLLNGRDALQPPPLPPDLGDLERLRDPKEKTALLWMYIVSVFGWLLVAVLVVALFGIPLIIIGFFWLINALGEMLFMAHLKTNAVRVSDTQLPELYRVVATSCARLKMPVPEVYVMQENVWNAFAAKFFGRRVVVLLSGAVDSILLKGDHQQLAWLVGHELGHHWAGHLNLSQKLAKMGGFVIWLTLWHSRRAELTSDRVGLYCAGNLKSAQRALINATVGAQLADRVNPEQAVAQWRQHRGEFFVCYRTLYSTHPQLLARLDYLNAAAREFGMAQ